MALLNYTGTIVTFPAGMTLMTFFFEGPILENGAAAALTEFNLVEVGTGGGGDNTRPTTGLLYPRRQD